LRDELDVDVLVGGIDVAFDTCDLEAVGVYGNGVATGARRGECEAAAVVGQSGDVG
jgi:hypothetical protein